MTSLELYIEKENFLHEAGFSPVDPFDFYRDLFPVGSFERAGDPAEKKANGMLVQLRKDEHPINRIIFDDLSVLSDYFGQTNVFVSPCSYYGKRKNASNARYCFGFAIDIDDVGKDQIRDLLHQGRNGIILMPTYCVLSGSGIHAYYFFNDPIPMYPQYQKFLKELKHALTERVWNDFTSMIPSKDRQYQGVLQSFRAVGTLAKCGKIITAYKTGKRVDVDEIMQSLPEGNIWSTRKKVDEAAKSALPLFEDPAYREKVSRALVRDNKLSLEEAKKLYPEWYQNTVVEKKPPRSWVCDRALYDWWLGRIRKEIQVGHRYNAILTLVIYANKCNIDDKELRRDAFSLLDIYEAKTEKEDNHFTKEDIEAALSAAKKDFARFPRSEIERLSGIAIPKTKRNGRPQKQHMKIMSSIRDIVHPDGEWRKGNGRPSAEAIVYRWQKNNPDGRKADCIRDTGLSKPTVYKWWKD